MYLCIVHVFSVVRLSLIVINDYQFVVNEKVA